MWTQTWETAERLVLLAVIHFNLKIFVHISIDIFLCTYWSFYTNAALLWSSDDPVIVLSLIMNVEILCCMKLILVNILKKSKEEKYTDLEQHEGD